MIFSYRKISVGSKIYLHSSIYCTEECKRDLLGDLHSNSEIDLGLPAAVAYKRFTKLHMRWKWVVALWWASTLFITITFCMSSGDFPMFFYLKKNINRCIAIDMEHAPWAYITFVNGIFRLSIGRRMAWFLYSKQAKLLNFISQGHGNKNHHY